MPDRCDVLVAGASFAGLAAAQRVRGRVVLVDRAPLGDGQTSACGMPLRLARETGAADSVLDEHRAIVIHTPRGSVTWPIADTPFCVVDYRRFCELAYHASGAEFVQASASGVERVADGFRVRTSAGTFEACAVIDATGWRAALAGQGDSRYVNRRLMAFGIETELPVAFDPGLHFYFTPDVPRGYAWAFPSGGATRFGVLSYLGETRLAESLAAFLAGFRLEPAGVHGGFLATGPRDPVRDGVFAVGEAAGLCLGLTGEGIRTAIHSGWRAGDLVQHALDGSLTITAAETAYRRYVAAERRRFNALVAATFAAMHLPPRVLHASARLLARPSLLRRFLANYFAILDPTRKDYALSPESA